MIIAGRFFPSPCGKVPHDLHVEGHGEKWGEVYGLCCGQWTIEFRAQYAEDEELKALGRNAWNEALRGGLKE